MGTRFYWTIYSNAAFTSLARDSDWESQGAHARGLIKTLLSPEKFFSVNVSYSEVVGNVADRAIVQAISDPMRGGQLISGTVKGQMQWSTGAPGAAATPKIGIRVVSRDGLTVRATLLSVNTYGASAMADVLTNRFLATTATATLSNYTTQQGDRLVLEIGFNKTTATNFVLLGVLGDNFDEDLPEDETDTSAVTKAPWLEFSSTILFEPKEVFCGVVIPPIITETPAGRPLMKAISQEITYRLCAVNSFIVRYPLSDPNIEDITYGKMIHLYHDRDGLMLSGYVEKITFDAEHLIAEGPSRMIELVELSARRRFFTTNLTFGEVFRRMLENTAWHANMFGLVQTVTPSLKFDGETKLQALINLAHSQVAHIREVPTIRAIEVDDFGADTGVVITASQIGSGLVNHPNTIALADAPVKESNGEAVFNWICALGGGGQGLGKLTLGNAVGFSDDGNPEIGPPPNLLPRLYDESTSLWTKFSSGLFGGTTHEDVPQVGIDGESFEAMHMSVPNGANVYVEYVYPTPTPFATYRFEMWVRPILGIATLEVLFRNAALATLATVTLTSGDGTQCWERLEWTQAAPANTDNIRIRLSLTDDSIVIINTEPGMPRMWRPVSGTYEVETEPSLDDIGSLMWIVKDDASIAAYRQKEAIVPFGDISANSSSRSDLRQAGISLYRAADAYLRWHKDLHVTYSCRLAGPLPRKTNGEIIMPGDQVRLDYVGDVYNVAGRWEPINVNELFYITSRRRIISEDGEHDEIELTDMVRFLGIDNDTALGKLGEQIKQLQLRG